MHQVGVFDAFKPFISFDAPEKGKSQWKQRLGAAVVLGGAAYLLATQTPDADFLKEELNAAHESLLDYLDLAGKHKRRVSYLIEEIRLPPR